MKAGFGLFGGGIFDTTLKRLLKNSRKSICLATGPTVAVWTCHDNDAGAGDARGEAGREPVDRTAAAKYVAELSAALANLARRHGLDALSYILDMGGSKPRTPPGMNGRR